MKTLTVVCMILAMAVLAVSPALSAGKIVLADDDWILSDSGFAEPNDPGVFATNVARWFTGGRTGSFLAYSTNFGLVQSRLNVAMKSAGNSWLVDRTGALDLPRLRSFDGVFLSVAYSTGVSASTLTEYVNTGGNVYLYAGAGPVETPWNEFLANFGLRFASTYNPLVENTPISSTHPIYAGVDHLFSYNGNNIIDLDPLSDANKVLVYSGTHGMFAVYDGSPVPEPSSLLSLLTGMGAMSAGVTFFRRR